MVREGYSSEQSIWLKVIAIGGKGGAIEGYCYGVTRIIPLPRASSLSVPHTYTSTKYIRSVSIARRIIITVIVLQGIQAACTGTTRRVNGFVAWKAAAPCEF